MICSRWPPWLRIVLVCSLRSARLDTAWLVKTYFDLICLIGWCAREFQRSKYKFSSHPKTGTHGQVWGNVKNVSWRHHHIEITWSMFSSFPISSYTHRIYHTHIVAKFFGLWWSIQLWWMKYHWPFEIYNNTRELSWRAKKCVLTGL